jgi:hypothetical protein
MSQFILPSTLNMQITCSSEMLVTTYKTTQNVTTRKTTAGIFIAVRTSYLRYLNKGCTFLRNLSPIEFKSATQVRKIFLTGLK